MKKHNLKFGLLFTIAGMFILFSFVFVYRVDAGISNLSYSQESGYVTDGVNPNTGTSFIFKIVYTNQNNIAPSDMRVFIFGTATTSIQMQVDTTAILGLRDGNFANGEQYAIKTGFPKNGGYYYRFNDSNDSYVGFPQLELLSFEVTGITQPIQKTIVLDPGHGRYTQNGVEKYQRDPNKFGVIEDVVVLEIGNKVRNALTQRGFRVLFSRDANSSSDPDRDPFVSSSPPCDFACGTRKRARWADDNKASAFVSIHTNGSSNHLAHGTETFYDRDCSGKIQQSQNLGQKILDQQLALGLPGFGGTTVKDANPIDGGESNVLCVQSMPSALTEIVFHSNDVLGGNQINEDLDGYKLITQNFKNAVAVAIANAVQNYYASL